MTIGTRSPAAQAASWSWWCAPRGSPVGAQRHHPATRLPVGQVPDVAGDRAAAALVGLARVGARAPHAVAVAGDRERGHVGRLEVRSSSNACTGVTTCVSPQVGGCRGCPRGRAAASAATSMPNGVPAAVSLGEAPARSGRSRSSHGANSGVVPRLVERREHRLGGEPAYERRPPRREGRGRRRSRRPSGRPARIVERPPAPGRRSILGGRQQRVVVERREVLRRQVGATVDQLVQAAGAVRRRERRCRRGRSAAPRRSLAVTTWPSGVVVRGSASSQPVQPSRVGRAASPPVPSSHRHPAGEPVAHRAVPVGDDGVVDRLDPAVERPVDVVDGARAQQRQERVEAEVAQHRRAARRLSRCPSSTLRRTPAPGRGHDLQDLRVGASTGIVSTSTVTCFQPSAPAPAHGRPRAATRSAYTSW